MLVLAIDLGTTWCKAAYIDPEGRVVAIGNGYSRFSMGHGISQPELERIWGAICSAVRAATDAARGGPPQAIGISCRGGTTLWLNRLGQSIPVQAYLDGAAMSRVIQATHQADIWGSAGPFAYGYVPALIGRTVWLKQREPSVWRQVARVGTLRDWLTNRLVGSWVTDPATGPGYAAWPPEAVALSELPLEAFPIVMEPEQPIGNLTPEAARDLGLPRHTIVVVGTHDGVAANIGGGAISHGDVCLTLGSHFVLRAVTGARVPGAFGYPILRDRWAWVRGVHGIAAQLDAVIEAVDHRDPPILPSHHANLTALAASVPPGSEGLRLQVLPPGFEAEQRRRIDGARNQGYSPGAVYRAALEGAAAAVRNLVEAATAAGVIPNRYVVTGGAAANRVLLGIIAGLLGVPLEVARPEAGLLGAAVLAAVGAGWFDDILHAIAEMVQSGERLVEAEATIRAYQALITDLALPRKNAP